VFFDAQLELYFAMYTDLFSVQVRTAPQPWGPWTASVVVFDPFEDYGAGAAFGTFIHSHILSDGTTLKEGDCSDGEHHPLCDRAHDEGREHEGGGVYGAWTVEKFIEHSTNGNITLYFLLSTQNPYTVVLLQTTLQPK